MKLSKNFSKSEFECNCGCKMPSDVFENVKELAKNLQVIRDAVGKPLHLTNAYRCKEHNKKVGGSKNSQHILGKAGDIKSIFITPRSLFKKIEGMIDKSLISEGGLGKYKTFTHYDIRGTKARWNNEK